VKAYGLILGMATGGCVMHQHLGSEGDSIDADVAPDARDPRRARDGGISDIRGSDIDPDVENDGPNSSTGYATCATSCGCEKADTCLLECTGSSGCVATCGVSRSCSIRLLGRNGSGDCRSTASCDVSCGASCLVDCGSSPCKIVCARGQLCAVKCGGSLPSICPDGVTVVCNGRGC
jgi:hypothetical protein